MPHIPQRWDGLGQWYFVTVVTRGRRPVFADKSACKILQNSFHEAHRHYPFRLAALVILPDHWHALIRPGIREAGEDVSERQQVVIEQIVGAVKRVVLRDMKIRDATIWQTRFLDHRIRDENDFLHHLDYIRLNPVKHGYAVEPDRYGWRLIHSSPFC
jgi:putative transposase